MIERNLKKKNYFSLIALSSLNLHEDLKSDLWTYKFGIKVEILVFFQLNMNPKFILSVNKKRISYTH